MTRQRPRKYGRPTDSPHDRPLIDRRTAYGGLPYCPRSRGDAYGQAHRPVRYLTAPLITPLMTHFWAKTYTMSTGAIAIR